jgi:hypothetical protein
MSSTAHCFAALAIAMFAVPAWAGSQTDDRFTDSIVQLPQGIDGDCYSYWGNEGRDWATLLISKSVFDRLASGPAWRSLAQRLLANVDPKPDAWGCTHIRDTGSAPVAMIFHLLESGQLVVVDDAANGPAGTILVRVHEGARKETSYHLRPGATPFLVQDPARIEDKEEDERIRNQPRRPWQIEGMEVTKQNAQRVKFVRRFMASCTSEDPVRRAFFRAHIRHPLAVRFSVVDENGAHGTTETVDMRHARDGNQPLGLPLCVGDGGLDDVVLSGAGTRMKLELSFGSGPNEELHFMLIGGQWQLAFAEWFDH